MKNLLILYLTLGSLAAQAQDKNQFYRPGCENEPDGAGFIQIYFMGT